MTLHSQLEETALTQVLKPSDKHHIYDMLYAYDTSNA